MKNINDFIPVALLCVPFLNIKLFKLERSSESKEAYYYNAAWGLLLVTITLIGILGYSDLREKLLALALGYMTSLSGLKIVLNRTNKIFKSRKSYAAMAKIPFLGSLVFLTLLGEGGVNLLMWTHWGMHLSILIILYLNKDLKAFFRYFVGALLITIFYITEKSFGEVTYFLIVFSIVTIFVTITLSKLEIPYENKINNS